MVYDGDVGFFKTPIYLINFVLMYNVKLIRTVLRFHITSPRGRGYEHELVHNKVV